MAEGLLASFTNEGLYIDHISGCNYVIKAYSK